MSREDRIIHYVESNFALERMVLSSNEKKIMHDCLSGKTPFSVVIDNIVAECRRHLWSSTSNSSSGRYYLGRFIQGLAIGTDRDRDQGFYVRCVRTS